MKLLRKKLKMGIKTGTKFFKEKCPHAFKTGDIKDFANSRIAIDTSIMANKIASGIHKTMLAELTDKSEEYDRQDFQHRFIRDFISHIIRWMKDQITPVFVFDGERRNEKLICTEKRDEQRQKLKDKVSEAYANYNSKNPLERTNEDDEMMVKARQNFYSIHREDYENLRFALTHIGIPWLIAPFDGEKLCASLSIEGLVKAVYSTDSDNYPLGTLNTITSIYPSGYIEYTDLMHILAYFNQELGTNSIEETLFMFREFYIMCGCDFNTNISKVGPVNSLKLLKQHRTIDGVGTVKDISCLNHHICRDIFSYEPSGVYSDTITINWTNFTRNAHSLVSYYGDTRIISLVSSIRPPISTVSDEGENVI